VSKDGTSYPESSTAPTNAGQYTVTAIVTDADKVGSASKDFTIAKETPTISAAPTASAITYGQTLAASILTGGTASTGGSFAFTTPSTAPNVGTASQGVTFSPSDTANYNSATTIVSVTVIDGDLPIAVDDSVTAAPIAGNVVKYAVAQLLSNDQYSAVNSSKAGLTLSIGLNTLSSNGGKVSKIGNWVVYQPSAKAISFGADSFTYTLGNGSGKTASGTVSIILGRMPDFTLGINIESVQVNTNGSGMIITFAVSPSKTFAVEGKTTLSDPWRSLGTKASETDGRLIVVDPEALPQNGFYRVRWIP
jgi:hypothetical protein